MRFDRELPLDLQGAIPPGISESAEADSVKFAQNSYVVKAQTSRADDADARSVRQITTPRSLASTNRISSWTSESGSSSVCARSIAWVTLRSDRNSSR